MKEEHEMPERQIATFRGDEPPADGDPVVIEREGEKVVVRRVPRLDSGETIHGYEALVASARELIARHQGS